MPDLNKFSHFRTIPYGILASKAKKGYQKIHFYTMISNYACQKINQISVSLCMKPQSNSFEKILYWIIWQLHKEDNKCET